MSRRSQSIWPLTRTCLSLAALLRVAGAVRTTSWLLVVTVALPATKAQSRSAEIACGSLVLGQACSYTTGNAGGGDRVWGHCYDVPRSSSGAGGSALQWVAMCLPDNRMDGPVAAAAALGLGNSTATFSQAASFVAWLADDQGWQALVIGAAFLCIAVCICTCAAVQCLREETGVMGRIRAAPTNEPWQRRVSSSLPWRWGAEARRVPSRRSSGTQKKTAAHHCRRPQSGGKQRICGAFSSTAAGGRREQGRGPQQGWKASGHYAATGRKSKVAAGKSRTTEAGNGFDIEQELRDAGLAADDDVEVGLGANLADAEVPKAAGHVRDQSGRRQRSSFRLQLAGAPAPLVLPVDPRSKLISPRATSSTVPTPRSDVSGAAYFSQLRAVPQFPSQARGNSPSTGMAEVVLSEMSTGAAAAVPNSARSAAGAQAVSSARGHGNVAETPAAPAAAAVAVAGAVMGSAASTIRCAPVIAAPPGELSVAPPAVIDDTRLDQALMQLAASPRWSRGLLRAAACDVQLVEPCIHRPHGNKGTDPQQRLFHRGRPPSIDSTMRPSDTGAASAGQRSRSAPAGPMAASAAASVEGRPSPATRVELPTRSKWDAMEDEMQRTLEGEDVAAGGLHARASCAVRRPTWLSTASTAHDSFGGSGSTASGSSSGKSGGNVEARLGSSAWASRSTAGPTRS